MKCVIVALFLLLTAGCSSRVALTSGLIREYGLSSADLTKLQLYISDDILLEKRVKRIDKDIDPSTYGLKKVEDYYVKQIYFQKKTPCVARTASMERLGIIFETDGDALTFNAAREDKQIYYVYAPDRLFARDTVENRPKEAGFGGWVTVGTETYADSTFTVLVDDELPIVLVDKTALRNFVVDSRKVKGVKQEDLHQQ